MLLLAVSNKEARRYQWVKGSAVRNTERNLKESKYADCTYKKLKYRTHSREANSQQPVKEIAPIMTKEINLLLSQKPATGLYP